MNEWEFLSEKIVFKSDLFSVKATRLVLPSGKKRKYYTAERRPSIFVFPLTKKHEVYLISQYRHMYKKTFLEAVAGFVDEGEIPLRAAQRELKEEVGISASHWEEISRFEMAHSVFKSSARMFLAQDLIIGEPKPEEDEQIVINKLTLQEAVEKVISGEINEAGSMIGILLLERLIQGEKI